MLSAFFWKRLYQARIWSRAFKARLVALPTKAIFDLVKMAPKKKAASKSVEKESGDGAQAEKQPKQPSEKEIQLREEYVK